jgi:hypothetical protein
MRIITGHHQNDKCSRRDLPEECTDKLTLVRMWKVLAFPLKEKRELKKKLHNFGCSESKQIFWLHSTNEIENFFNTI